VPDVSEPPRRRRLVFFDVDKTLIDANSATLWLRREVRLGHISRRQAARLAFWISLYTLGFARMEAALADATMMLRDLVEGPVVERTNAFFEDEIRALLRHRAIEAIESHRSRGDGLYLLTTSSTYLSSLLAEELRLDGYLCNRFEVVDGRFTGRFHPPLCYGEGKVTHASALARELGVSLEDCVFYTDSYSDLPMLLAVGEPVVVNPDLRLRRYARKRGWVIQDWSLSS
jgi:HAD superfamily hydrolase (TIGR01490 family)